MILKTSAVTIVLAHVVAVLPRHGKTEGEDPTETACSTVVMSGGAHIPVNVPYGEMTDAVDSYYRTR